MNDISQTAAVAYGQYHPLVGKKQPVVTQVQEAVEFFPAEEYHQDYEKNNPNNPYVQQVSIPRLRKFQKQYPELLKEEH